MDAVWSALGVRPEERRRVALFAVYSMAVVGGVVIVGSLAGRALFLSALPREHVALKFLLPPVALAGAVGLYSRISQGIRRDRLVVGTSLLLAAVALGLRAGLAAPFGDGLFFLSVLYVALEVAGALAIIQFWTFAGDLFDAREAKRLFGLIAAGGTVAAVLFSAGLGAAARALAPADLLFVLAAALGLVAVCAARLGRDHRAALEADAQRARPRAQAGAKEPSGLAAALPASPLARAIAGVILAGAVASAIADYQLDLALQAHYATDAAGMVQFLGALRAGAGVVALLLQLLVARHLLARLGLRGGLMALPLLMLLGQGAIVATGGVLLAAALPKAVDGALKFDLNNTSINLLYMPLPPEQRGRMKARLDGILKPAVLSALGVAFLIAGRFPSVTLAHWAFAAGAVCLLWIASVRGAALAYVAELRAGLRQRRLDGSGTPLSLTDETSARVLAGALSAEDPGLVLQALAVLEEVDGSIPRRALVGLLEHGTVEVRLRAVEQLGRDGDVALVPALRTRLEEDDSVEVRCAALVALAANAGPAAAALVLPYLADPRPDLRAAAVRGALLHLGIDGILHAANVLKELLEDEDPAMRAEGARTLGALGARSFYAPLLTLLEDPEPAVRLAALRSAAQLGARALVPSLVSLLDEPRLAREAQRALVACLEDEPRAILEPLRSPTTSARQRIGLVQALSGLGTAGRALLDGLLLDPTDRVRGAAARALRLSGGAVEASTVPRSLDQEEATIGRLAQSCAALMDDAPHTAAALRDRLDEALDRVLDLLGLQSPTLQPDLLRESIRSRDRRVAANALELLDNVVDPARRALVLALAERDLPALVAQAQARGSERSPPSEVVLAGMAADGDPWLRSCALFDGEGSGFHALVRAALADPDPLVVETARATARRMGLAEAEDWETTMAMTTLEKVLFLKSIPLFATLHGETLAQIAPIAQEVRCGVGECFIRAGERGDCLYVVVDGEVDVRSSEDTIATAESRSIIGELAVLAHRPRNTDCVALTDLLLLRIDKEDFWALLEERPELSTGVLRQIIDRYV